MLLSMPTRWSLPRAILVATLAGGAAGCASTKPTTTAEAHRPMFPSLTRQAKPVEHQPDSSYRVGAGDLLVIRTPRNAKGELAEVRADGCLHFGDDFTVRVDGLTTSQISAKLTADPSFGARTTVGVQRYNSQFIHVYGLDSLDRSQTVPFRGKEKLAELLARVGCRGCRNDITVRVVRPAETVGGMPEVFTAKCDGRLNEREAGDIVVVKANDYVYVDRGKPTAVATSQRKLSLNPFQWFAKSSVDATRTVAHRND